GPKPRVGVKLGRLGMGARVVPQDAGAQDVVGTVEEHGTVHLPRKADAAHGGPRRRGQVTQRRLCRRDPVGRGLLAPAVVGPRHRQRRRRLGNDLLGLVDQDALQARSAEIEPEEHAYIAPGPGMAEGGHLPAMIMPSTSSWSTSAVLTVPTTLP